MFRPFRRPDQADTPAGRRPLITYANVVATLALFLAIGGGVAWAQGEFVITSASQIKPSVRTALAGPAYGTKQTTDPQHLTGHYKQIAGLEQKLPAGSYVLTADLNTAVSASSASFGIVECELVDGRKDTYETGGSSLAGSGPYISIGALSLQLTVSSKKPSTAKVECDVGPFTEVGVNENVSQGTLTAVQASSIK